MLGRRLGARSPAQTPQSNEVALPSSSLQHKPQPRVLKEASTSLDLAVPQSFHAILLLSSLDLPGLLITSRSKSGAAGALRSVKPLFAASAGGFPSRVPLSSANMRAPTSGSRSSKVACSAYLSMVSVGVGISMAVGFVVVVQN